MGARVKVMQFNPGQGKGKVHDAWKPDDGPERKFTQFVGILEGTDGLCQFTIWDKHVPVTKDQILSPFEVEPDRGRDGVHRSYSGMFKYKVYMEAEDKKSRGGGGRRGYGGPPALDVEEKEYYRLMRRDLCQAAMALHEVMGMQNSPLGKPDTITPDALLDKITAIAMQAMAKRNLRLKSETRPTEEKKPENKPTNSEGFPDSIDDTPPPDEVFA